jgi:hypothetical protein
MKKTAPKDQPIRKPDHHERRRDERARADWRARRRGMSPMREARAAGENVREGSRNGTAARSPPRAGRSLVAAFRGCEVAPSSRLGLGEDSLFIRH